jgi:L-fuconolactonase
MLFDSHAHLISDNSERYPPAPLSGALRAGDLDDPVTAERLIQFMDIHNVEKALVVQRAHVYGFNNHYIVDSAKQYSDRLSAMCMIDALAPKAPDTIRHWVEDCGAIAIRMTEPHKGAGPDWFASEQAQESWKISADLGISIRIQLYGWNRDICLPALAQMLEKFPDVPVVIDHLSSPPPELGAAGIDEHLQTLSGYPNLGLLVSTINFSRLKAAQQSAGAVLEQAIALFGSERLMWGSDIAQSKGSYAEMTQAAIDATRNLKEEDRHNILYQSGLNFYS